ncbi:MULTISPECIES: RtcB family protein [Halobacterium]|uniref:RtcB family protein n=1 Tax=Halobacterium TaxID=2239 RepID=UPI00196331A3|nr:MULTISPECIES: RtcB family protein [Halobacterium]MDL0122381.1 RtcB family protein [Halobacterium salinarum]QRY23906.1 RtcB family protein [Halobacterium sp. BOL4-2]
MSTFDADGHRLTEVEPDVWALADTGDESVPARVLANRSLLAQISTDNTLTQLRNVAGMPGAVAPALCMPDGHQGYGFPVGGVAAFDAEDGCISPGGVGFDINCGVRMLTTTLTYDDVKGREAALVDALYDAVPCGLGGGGVHDGTHADLDAALERGIDWCVEEGYAVPADRRHCEDEGRRLDADLDAVSKKARDRGASQMGSLGSGNHFLEVQRVTDVYDDDTAAAFGLAEDQVVVLIHCGSRGLGHQICSDYLRRIEQEHPDFLASLPNKDLAAAPAGSELAASYYGAMCAAINFAWVNRQLITHAVRETFADVFDAPDWEALGMDLLYDVSHNIAKRETHAVVETEDGYSLAGDGERVERELFVHRKGATRAFPAGHPEVPAAYREVGQPVIIPGSMGAGSYVLRGGSQSLGRTFGSTAHGAGRLMSRTQAKDEYQGGDVQDALEADDDIHVKAASGATIAEEAPGVYKDIDDVVDVSDGLGVGDPVVRTYPVCNVKG